MKLELKHLAPYLPYGVRLTNTDQVMNGRMCELLSTYSYTEKKPILRPLSDLTKEINHEGKKFTAAELMWNIDAIEKDQFDLFGKMPSYWNANISLLKEDVRNVDYGDFLTMTKYHFDVFGLIKEGLAVDINTSQP